MKILAVINKGAGSVNADDRESEEARLKEEFEKHGALADVEILEGDELDQRVKRGVYEGYDAIAAGGGDGTISNAAGILCKTDIALGVLPMGTLNHFAKDNSIPRELEKAIEVIVKNNTAYVDIADVNERTFINNSSIGFYPKAVKERENNPGVFKIAKWLSTLAASIKIFVKFPLMEVKLEVEGKKIDALTPIVFIGNNNYKMDLFRMGERETLKEGRLYLYYLNCTTRSGLFKVLLHSLTGSMKEAKDFVVYSVKEVTIVKPRGRIHVALDGEVEKMTTPLHYKIHERSLKVIIPEKTTEEQ